jgi:hypothetical protein
MASADRSLQIGPEEIKLRIDYAIEAAMRERPAGASG